MRLTSAMLLILPLSFPSNDETATPVVCSVQFNAVGPQARAAIEGTSWCRAPSTEELCQSRVLRCDVVYSQRCQMTIELELFELDHQL
eukprot:m.1143668 g.1143668  ORF g.1143668 m.1143668 type:complete len:88 (+) comp24459_c0_seq6:229-492(+)